MPPRAPLPTHLRTAISSKMKRNEAVQVICPYCLDFTSVMSFKVFREEHICNVHHLDPKRECIFCGGEFRWRAGQKGCRPVSAHIFRCMNTFLSEYKTLPTQKKLPKRVRKVPNTGVTGKPSENNLQNGCSSAGTSHSLCECVDFNSSALAFDMIGRKRLPEFKEFYEPLLNEKPVDFWYKPTLGDVGFQRECGLGCEVAGMIRMQRSGRWTFYHVFLRPCVIQFFNEVMGDTKLLHHVAVSPFGCLCDGLRSVEEEGRHHRHVIVATDLISEFAQACKKAHGHQTNHKGCVRKYHIKNIGHLISVIRYVSSPESCGNHSPHTSHAPDSYLSNSDVGKTKHHYYISRPMHRHAIVAMSVLYPGGLRWLAYKHNSGKKISRWNYQERRLRNGTWKYSVRLGDTGIQMQDCVLRWAKDMELVGVDDMPGEEDVGMPGEEDDDMPDEEDDDMPGEEDDDMPGEEDDGCEPPYIPVSKDEGLEVGEASTSSDEVLQQPNEETSFRIFFDYYFPSSAFQSGLVPASGSRLAHASGEERQSILEVRRGRRMAAFQAASAHGE